MENQVEENLEANLDAANSFANALKEEVEVNPELPIKFGEIDYEQFNTALVEATNGGLSSIEELRQALGLKDDYEATKKERDLLAEQVSQDPFANEYVKGLNTLLKSNATQKEIDIFTRVQKIELDNLSAKETLQMKISLDNPELSDDEVNALINEQYGEDDDDRSDYQKGKMKIAATKARKSLSELKISSKEPDSVKQEAARAKKWNGYKNYWTQVELVAPFPSSYTYEYTGKDGKKAEFSFAMKKEDIAAYKKGRLDFLLHKVQLPTDGSKETIAAYKKSVAQYHDSFMMVSYHKEIMKAFEETLTNNATLAANQSHHNTQPRNNPLPRTAATTEGNEIVASIDKFIASRIGKG